LVHIIACVVKRAPQLNHWAEINMLKLRRKLGMFVGGLSLSQQQEKRETLTLTNTTRQSVLIFNCVCERENNIVVIYVLRRVISLQPQGSRRQKYTMLKMKFLSRSNCFSHLCINTKCTGIACSRS
jgi:hypothetical protein